MRSLKYFLMVFSTLILLNACKSEDNYNYGSDNKSNHDEMNFFRGRINGQMDILPEENLGEDAGPETRATMADGKITAWHTSDKISISDGVLNFTYQPSSSNINGASCGFEPKSGTNAFTTDGDGQDATYYAFYPAEAVLGWNGPNLTTMIYTEQKYSENIDNSGIMGPYMAAVATTTDGGTNAVFSFGHICSVVDVDLSGFDKGVVDAVAIYSNSQVSIAGRMKFNTQEKSAVISNNDATDYSFSTQSELIRVSEINQQNPIVRFFVLPVAQQKGFTITVKTKNGEYFTKSSSSPVGTTASDDEYLASLTGVTSATICKPYYKKYNFGSSENARTQNWMAMIPGNVKFNFLSVPGTHDAATSTCSSMTQYTVCQDFTIEEQLQKGCRAFDLRPHTSKNTNGDPIITHSSYESEVSFGNALGKISEFLDNNPTETVFVLVHEEDASSHSATWADRVWNVLNNYNSYVAAYGWRGNLNPCRGKMVVIFRDNYTDGTNHADLKAGKVGWGSSFNAKSILFGNNSASSDAYQLFYQDEYEYSSSSYASDKLSNMEKMLTNYIAPNETNINNTYVNNANAVYSGLFGLPQEAITNIAKKVNNAVLNSNVFTTHKGRFGIMMVDFLFSSDYYGDKMFSLIHEQNFNYVYKDRSRCQLSEDTGDDTDADISSDEYADDSQVYSKQR